MCKKFVAKVAESEVFSEFWKVSFDANACIVPILFWTPVRQAQGSPHQEFVAQLLGVGVPLVFEVEDTQHGLDIETAAVESVGTAVPEDNEEATRFVTEEPKTFETALDMRQANCHKIEQQA